MNSNQFCLRNICVDTLHKGDIDYIIIIIIIIIALFEFYYDDILWKVDVMALILRHLSKHDDNWQQDINQSVHVCWPHGSFRIVLVRFVLNGTKLTINITY